MHGGVERFPGKGHSRLMLETVQALAWYFPDSTGGTEVYVNGLVNSLKTRNVESVVIAPWERTQEDEYVYDDVVVYRYPIPKLKNKRQLRGETPPDGFQWFCRWLDRQSADIYHQHSWTVTCNHHHLAYAKSIGKRTVVTVHIPSAICLRGTMMLNGKSPCDGEVRVRRCSRCWLLARGAGRGAAGFASLLPVWFSRLLRQLFGNSRFSSYFGTAALVHDHAQQFGAFVTAADSIVAVCGWLFDALRRNNVPDQKLRLIRQAVPAAWRSVKKGGRSRQRLRVGYFGRCEYYKGLHVLLDAVASLEPNDGIVLNVYGADYGEAGDEYMARIKRAARSDSRINLKGVLGGNDVAHAMAEVDVVVVPSITMETGPLVVLEAQSIGVPVVGSRIGGIAELVVDGVDGILVEPGSAAELSAALIRLYRDDVYLSQLTDASRRPTKTYDELADEMLTTYKTLNSANV